jgi:hypothetical protein
MSQVVEYLPSMQKALSLIPNTTHQKVGTGLEQGIANTPHACASVPVWNLLTFKKVMAFFKNFVKI